MALPGPRPLAGYSGKPLPEKLGYKPGMVAAFIALPPDSRLGGDRRLHRGRPAAVVAGRERRFDLIHAFTERAESQGLPLLQAALKRDGMIWVSWPKKAAKVATDVTEDVVRAEAFTLDLVDVKVAAIDAVGPA